MRRYALPAITALLVTIAACGDGATTTTAVPTTTGPTTTTSPAPTTTAAPPTTGVTTTSPEPFAVYENREYGFRLTYPSDWSLSEGEFGSIVTILSPLLGTDSFAENVNVVAEDLTGSGLTLDEYVELSLGTIAEFIDEFELLDEGADLMGGVEAWTIFYSGEGLGLELLWVQTLAIHRDWGFVFTYTGERDFEHFVGDALSIFESWEFLGN